MRHDGRIGMSGYFHGIITGSILKEALIKNKGVVSSEKLYRVNERGDVFEWDSNSFVLALTDEEKTLLEKEKRIFLLSQSSWNFGWG